MSNICAPYRATRSKVVTDPNRFSGLTPTMSLADMEFVTKEKRFRAALQWELGDAALDLVTDLPDGLRVLAGRVV
jgi:hypothetical protein